MSNSITVCPSCNMRLSGGVEIQKGELSAYFVGIADTEEGICFGRVKWPRTYMQISFTSFGRLNFCPNCGYDFRKEDGDD